MHSQLELTEFRSMAAGCLLNTIISVRFQRFTPDRLRVAGLWGYLLAITPLPFSRGK